jgi:hypothetical protein
MTEPSGSPEQLQAMEAEIVAGVHGDEVAHRLEGIRRDIELALADVEAVLRRAAGMRDDEQLDA